MLQNLSGWHALIILAIVVLIFGAAKLPALAKSVGESLRILKTEVTDPVPAMPTTTAPAPTPPVPASAAQATAQVPVANAAGTANDAPVAWAPVVGATHTPAAAPAATTLTPAATADAPAR